MVLVSNGRSASARSSNCPNANPWDGIPDSQAINACLAAGGDVILADTGGGGKYIIDSGLVISVPGTRLIGEGGGAFLEATPSLQQRMLSVSWINNVQLINVWLHGNKWERTAFQGQCTGSSRDNFKNILLQGDNTFVDGIVSSDALCGSSLEIEGASFEVRNSEFNDNGFEKGPTEPWSDGLTVWRCTNGYIHDNSFRDNTDVDLVTGGGSGCLVERNTIVHQNSYGFAGLQIGDFLGGGGDHGGSTYRWNSVTSAYKKLNWGIMVGNHPWVLASLPNAGTVISNSTYGAVIPLAVDGIEQGTILDNSYGNHQGTFNRSSCVASFDYTAADFGGGVVLQPGYVRYYFHPGSTCGPW
jgi:hypothetical protein